MSKLAAAVLSLLCLILFALPSSAQLLPDGNVYVGGSHSLSEIVVNKYDFWGWNASVEDFPLSRFPYLGVVLDASGFYRPGITQYNFLLGPRFSKTYGNWRPFVQALGGLQRVTSDGNAYNPVAFDFGGGVDRKLHVSFWHFKNFSWRVQADYVNTRYLSAREIEFRGSTGLVWRF
ncbi:MAG TPA: hypothetical protein VIH89_02625 [Candidatus Sulfotelmatobacter sp.]